MTRREKKLLTRIEQAIAGTRGDRPADESTLRFVEGVISRFRTEGVEAADEEIDKLRRLQRGCPE